MAPDKSDTTPRKEPHDASAKPRHPDQPPNGASTPPPDPTAPHPAHRRTSKIARLPHEIRQLLNIMLRDGAPYDRIAHSLSDRGHKISVNNLSRWHSTGYNDWLQEQAWLEEMRLRLDFAGEVAHEKNAKLLDAASLRIAITRMYTFLLSFDPRVLTAQVASHPGAYSRILNSLCHLTQASINCERNRRDDQVKASTLSQNAASP